MNARMFPLLIALTAIVAAIVVAGTPAVLRAEDPGASLIENKSGSFYRIRISDNAAPVGVVKIFDADGKTLLKEMKSKDEAHLMDPKSKVKMVICGSPKAKGLPVAIHISLDSMKGDKGDKEDKHSVVRLHFVHGLLGTTLVKDPSGKIDPVTKDKENDAVITNIANYQKAADGNLWEIK